MTALLTILKVIGWILLGILGLILLTVLTVLLVPIRYRADGVWKEEKYIRGRVTWLLHLLSIRVTYEKELLLDCLLYTSQFEAPHHTARQKRLL